MNKVKMHGNEIILEGNLPKIGDKICEFSLKATDMSSKTAKDYEGKALVLLTVPSIDTPVCDMELKKFNNDAASLPDDVKIIGVSADLPFAQARWSAETGNKNIHMLSDYYDMNFAKNFGVHIKDLRLLARAVFVYDKTGTLVYSELVEEVTNEPNYSKALEAVKKVVAEANTL